jgi:hypothetical protein
MAIDRLGNELQALGVSGRHARSLLLLPQIYMGWASEHRDQPALEALLETTARGGGFGTESYDLARAWLFERPTRAQFQSGFALLRALRRAPDNPVISSSDVLESMLWACRAAQLDREPGAARGGYGAVTPTAQRALFDLQVWLEVDIDELAVDLLSASAEEVPRDFEESSVVQPTSRKRQRRVLELLDQDDRAAPSGRADAGGMPPASSPFPLLRRLG